MATMSLVLERAPATPTALHCPGQLRKWRTMKTAENFLVPIAFSVSIISAVHPQRTRDNQVIRSYCSWTLYAALADPQSPFDFNFSPLRPFVLHGFLSTKRQI